MSPRIVQATAVRVLRQLRHDPRTTVLLLLIPSLLMALIKWVFLGQDQVFQRVGVPLVGIFPLTAMFIVTSIAMLRERVNGTLERLMTMPLARVDLLFGYGVAFGVAAAAQAAVTSAVAFGLLGLEVSGPIWAIILIAVLNAVLGSALGLFVSAFARTEFQAVQFMPVFIMPQVLVCGLFAPRDHMAWPLRGLATGLPMTYAYDALHRIAIGGGVSRWLTLDVAVLGAVTVIALMLGAASLPRRTP